MVNDAVGIVTKLIDEFKQSKEEQRTKPSTSKSFRGSTRLRSLQSSQSIQEYGQQSRPHLTERTKSQTASAVAPASAKSLGNVIGRSLKGLFVDGPLAVADGVYSVPKLNGSDVQTRKKITKCKRGVIVAGVFVFGSLGGVVNLVVKPYQGGKKEGGFGVAKGVGKGAL